MNGGRARLMFSEDANNFHNQKHMNHLGELNFTVNETCPSCDHFLMIAPNDRDSHNPVLAHLQPLDMHQKERRDYIPSETKIQGGRRRKEIHRENTRTG